jgi:hypothetical protein
MAGEIPERYLIDRQIRLGRGWPNDSSGPSGGNVSGRVLDRIKGEILLHMPELEDHPNLDNLVRSIPKRLARPEPFDHDASMDADKRWQRGMFAPKSKEN